MNLLKNVLKMEVFKPHIKDPDYPISIRVHNKPIALINYGSQYITVMKACFHKKWEFEESKTYSPEDPLIEKALEEYSPERLLAISYGDRACITLEDQIKDTDHSIKSMDQAQSIVTKTNPASLLKIQNKYQEMDFSIVRIQSTGLNLLNCMLAESLPKNSCIIILDQEYMIGVRIHNGHWSRVRTVLLGNNELLTQALEELFFDDIECVKYWDTNSEDKRFKEIVKPHGIEKISMRWEPKNFLTTKPELELLTYA